jgi:hypothetical protein
MKAGMCKLVVSSLFLLLLLTLAPIKTVDAAETIYIRENGGIEGTSKIISTDSVTYTFTDNIEGTIQIERNNTILDGAGYSLIGAYETTGINLQYRSNVTIKNLDITKFQSAITIRNT